MIAYIDVNVWLYLANPISPFHAPASHFLAPYLQGTKNFAVSWQIFYEFIRAATDPRLYAVTVSWLEAFHFIDKIFRHSGVEILLEGPSHPESLKFALEKGGYKQGPFVHDCHIAALLHENGIKTIVTADQDFRRFPFLEVLDPTA
ncbi:MAG: PIN domain-containing protein [Deltaproteobacteria bacterium]|nr:PIN domain-containing protein [Deltaproteobacteria bacterium]